MVVHTWYPRHFCLCRLEASPDDLVSMGLNLKSFLIAKKNKGRKQPTKWEEIVANHTSFSRGDIKGSQQICG